MYTVRTTAGDDRKWTPPFDLASFPTEAEAWGCAMRDALQWAGVFGKVKLFPSLGIIWAWRDGTRVYWHIVP
jgi:hypothetical protein